LVLHHRRKVPRIAAIRFDLFRGQGVPWPDFVEDVRFIETTGAGTCWVLDHYFYPPAPEAQLLDSWTALGGLAAVTERIRLGTMVTDAALRHPAVLAKQIATVDRISNGRVDVTIGAGHFQEELEALGVSFLTPRGRADRLRGSWCVRRPRSAFDVRCPTSLHIGPGGKDGTVTNHTVA